jgi:hypothetical protein
VPSQNTQTTVVPSQNTQTTVVPSQNTQTTVEYQLSFYILVL